MMSMKLLDFAIIFLIRKLDYIKLKYNQKQLHIIKINIHLQQLIKRTKRQKYIYPPQIPKNKNQFPNIQRQSFKKTNNKMQREQLIHNCLIFQHKKQKYIYGLTLLMINSNYLTKYKPNYIIIPSQPYIYGIFCHAGLEYLFNKYGRSGQSSNRDRDAKTPLSVQLSSFSNSSNNVQMQQQPLLLDKIAKYSKIIVCNQKKLQQYYPSQLISAGIKSSITTNKTLKQLQLQQKQLITKTTHLIKQRNKISVLQQQHEQIQKHQQNKSMRNIEKNKSKQVYKMQKQGKVQLLNWINCPVQELKIIIPESGMTTYLCYGNQLIVVDPTQQFVYYLNNQYIHYINNNKYNKFIHTSTLNQNNNNNTNKTVKQDGKDKDNRLIYLLRTIIVTKMSSVIALLGLLIANGVQRVKVLVASQQLQDAIIQKAQKYLHYIQQLTRSRFLIRQISPYQSIQSTKPHRYPLLTGKTNPHTPQQPNSLTCTYTNLSQNSQSMLQIQFGCSIDLKNNKKIIFLTPNPNKLMLPYSYRNQLQLFLECQIKIFPKEIPESCIDFFVMYKIEEGLSKQLKALPHQLRKKIIYNRSEHKYNHKYFYTFEKNKIQYCTVTNIQYINLLTNRLSINKISTNLNTNSSNYNTHFNTNTNKRDILINIQQGQVRLKNTNKNLQYPRNILAGCKIYEMGNNAEIEVIGQAVKVLNGFVEVYEKQFNQSKGEFQLKSQVYSAHHFVDQDFVLRNCYKIRAFKYAQIQIMMENQYQILSKKIYIEPPTQQRTPQSSPQKATKTQNSQSSHNLYHHLQTIQNNSLIQSLTAAQKQQLNQICHPVTYEVGLKTNNKNTSVYFISKGGMKWEDSQEIAGSGSFIGDLASYYRGRDLWNKGQEVYLFSFDNFIQVIKDTWALQINIEEFHKYFILKNPHLFHLIFTKGKIFH